MLKLPALILALLFCGSAVARAEGAPPARQEGPRRLALIIGANAAAPGRKALRYSQQDAREVGRVLTELGGFDREDVSILLDPEPASVLTALESQLARVRSAGQEAMIVFYYSGHADATALYPAGRPLPLADVRARLSDPRVSVRIGIIDACRGGGWTGAKGLNETAPFEVDLPSALLSEGSVLIASSSGLEDAHESEELGGSFFTHHWIAALRGAADRNADGLVTLTEAFDYARALTIRDTALHTVSPQHPSFSMQLRGRNDLPLSTLHSASALLAVDQRVGPLELVHLGSGMLVLELPKGERSLRLAVAPGRYVLRRRSGERVWAQEIAVTAGQTAHVAEEHLTLVGTPALAIKSGTPRTLTLTSLPRGKQEITGWLGVTHGSSPGVRIATDDNFEFGMIAPRGLTDRWQWILPSLAFAYRGGDPGGIEWLPWGGIVGWGMGGSSIEGFILEAQPGFGFDLRTWLGARSSLDFGIGFGSGFRWTSRDPDDSIVVPRMASTGEPAPTPDTPQWIPPDTWRAYLAVGYTYTLADAVTFHFALRASQTQLFAGELANHRLRSREGSFVLGVGGVQSMGLRPLPLVRIHVRDWFALNVDASVRYDFAARSLDETYLAGMSFVW